MSCGQSGTSHGTTIDLSGFALSCLFVSAAQAQDAANCRSTNPAVAIPSCTTLIEKSASQPAALSDALARRAIAYRRANRVDEAMADANRAIEIAPNGFGYNTRATVLMQRGKLKEALDDLDKAIARDATSAAPQQTAA